MSALTLEEAQDHLDKYRMYIADKKSPSNPNYMYYRIFDYYHDTLLVATGSTWGALIIIGIILAVITYEDVSFFSFLISFAIGAVIFIVSAIAGVFLQSDADGSLGKEFTNRKIFDIMADFPQLISSDIQTKIGWDADNVDSNWKNNFMKNFNNKNMFSKMIHWDV